MTNRLADSSSPYLRQHADNPVDWWPWSDDALAAARAQQKPILLSIGYSACHWCHVMAHESFEDAATATLMNDLFICIKVDREERPDIDKIYQLAHQALTRRGGGWPLTVFLAPDDHVPFYAGTYFPKDGRYGMPPFAYVLKQVRAFWDDRRDDVRSQNAALASFLDDYGKSTAFAGSLDEQPIGDAVAQIEHGFDHVHGGHRGAPKFPHGPEMELLLDLESPTMVELTLRRMSDGGIYDQLGGGFCRYSVDDHWEIPHFEKMLYDNAQLLPLYAATTSGAPIARGIVAWLRREMTSPNGAFYSALDADSEHEEGKFYVWQRDDIRNLLDADEFAVASRYFGFDREPNFEGHAWNPIVAATPATIAAERGESVDAMQQRVDTSRTKLFAARAHRIRPGLDDKILTSWNALMIGGLARAARALDDATLQHDADRALDALYANAWTGDRLFATSATTPRIDAYLDDYAFLLDALLECLQSRWRERDLHWAIALADALLARFEDTDGGFFFTANDQPRLIQRPKPWLDEAIPSGNGVAARALLRLGHLLGETRYLDAAERTLRAAYATLQQTPAACVTLQRALNDWLSPRTHVIVRAAPGDEMDRWRNILMPACLRRTDVYIIPPDIEQLPTTLAAQRYAPGGLAYICRGTRCLAPIADPAAARAEIDASLYATAQ